MIPSIEDFATQPVSLELALTLLDYHHDENSNWIPDDRYDDPPVWMQCLDCGMTKPIELYFPNER